MPSKQAKPHDAAMPSEKAKPSDEARPSGQDKPVEQVKPRGEGTPVEQVKARGQDTPSERAGSSEKAKPRNNGTSGTRSAESAPALTVPAAAPPAPEVVEPPKKPRSRSRPIDEKVIEACSYTMHKLGGPRICQLGVLSSVRGEGRTSIAAAMAYVQSHDYGRSTLLLDADFDGPHLASMYGLASSPGAAEVVASRAGIDEAIHRVDGGLTVMTAGDVPNPPSRLAKELASSSLLAELHEDFEVVIADLPAVLHSASGAILAQAFDNTVLVVRAAVTPIPRVREAVSALDADPMVMLNGTHSKIPYWLRRFFP
jgi:Mrp family chromosome partitioning ATPase